MATNCIDSNALNRSGSSREQRVLKALLPLYAPVDDRSFADLVLFAKKYAAYLNYYNDENVVEGDWSAFMSMDVSVTLAGITNTPVAAYQSLLKTIYQNTRDAASEDERKKHFKNVFELLFSIVQELDSYLTQLPADVSFAEYFSSTIQARLQDPLQRLVFYYNSFVAAGYIDPASEFLPAGAPLEMTLSQDFDATKLSAAWQATVNPISLSVPDPSDVSASIYHIITHNVFNAQLDVFFKTLSTLISQSGTFLEETLFNFPKHSPHYALYISFLHLYKVAQEQLNTFASRHLDFYYQDVLQLKTKDAVSDSAHLVVELQKGIAQHKIDKGVLFKGGKDADGIEITYAADAETVINRATVASLMSVLVKEEISKGKAFENVYASPIANSEDGQGAKLLSAGGDWFAFGDPAKVKEAKIGFAVASHYLYLNEGQRSITIQFHFGSNISLTQPELADAFDIQLTGKKDWVVVEDYSVFVSQPARTLSFSFSLPADAAPIIGFSAKLHKEAYATDLPVARFYLKNVRGVINPYAQLKQLPLTKIVIQVSVSGKRDVVLQNDEGALDPSKPFLPFGAQPSVGSSLLMGSKEIFQKKLTALSVVVDWDDVPDSLVSQLDEALKEFENTLSYLDMKRKFHTVKVSALNKAQWTTLDTQKGIFIEDNLYDEIYNWSRPEYKYARKLTTSDIEHAVINVSVVNIQPGEQTYDANEAYSNKVISGFVKLELNHPDFGHRAYPEALRNAAQSVTVTVTGAGTENMTMNVQPTGTVPKEPYTPKIKTFTVNYTAAAEINLVNVNAVSFEGKGNNFFHLTTFGYNRVNKQLHPTTTIVPAYTNEGELYIGFKELLPTSTLHVLFQVADGTSNPLKQQAQVDWFYLADNVWNAFTSSDVIDATKEFSQSGIITFVLPAAIDTGNTILDPSMSWIKAVVKKDADAIAKLVDVKAQAISVSLVADAGKNIFFKQHLASNIISKLVVADASVKKLTQPFESAGGRIKEPAEMFYTRVSERLRHKQRSITAWDYEKMVLEEFPSVYKVKCIQHAGLLPTKLPGITKYSETAPGNVAIVTIPDLRGGVLRNPLKPYTSVGLLTNIKDYLLKYTSPFVKLFVLNPKFEEVQFEFNVVITPPLDETFYVNLLSMDIEKFLCPWAYNDGSDIEFGGRIAKSVVLNFIEERPYVDFVTCFKMHHYIDRDLPTAIVHRDIEEAKASTGISILVSYFNTQTNVRHLVQHGKKCEC